MTKTEQADESVCSTSEAARLLGVSNTTVQIMVERGELQAWKTRGGHRRITLSSIDRLKSLRESRLRSSGGAELLSVLVVEDDQALRVLYEQTIQGWGLPLKLNSVSDGMEALIQIERSRPDVLILDLFMRPMDGFQLLQMLRSHREFNEMVIIVVTGLDEQEIANRGGLPKGVVVYRKPVPFEKLQGFVEAALLKKQLAAT
jgi:excisionase family DNA binding protein